MGTGGVSVSVGVCAYNEADHVHGLLESLLSQPVPEPFAIQEILVVASGCTDGTEGVVRRMADHDPRIQLISEPERRGKASALNRVLETYRGDVLVLANADARLAPDALASLLPAFLEFPELWVACGAAFADGHHTLPSAIEAVLWDLHNRMLSVRSARNLDNHCCDELMAMRRGFVESLPPDLINDGAYLGVLAGLSGQTVRFCEAARVHVATPRTVRGWLERRRRILRGHRQVRLLLHRPSNTLESLARRDPLLAARILAEEIRDRPAALLILLLLAIPLEGLSFVLARSDELRSPSYAAIWPKVDSS